MKKKSATPQKAWKPFGILVSPRQIAEIMGINRKTVTNWLDDGSLVSVYVGHKHRKVHRDVLRVFLHERGYAWAVDSLDAHSVREDQEAAGTNGNGEAT